MAFSLLAWRLVPWEFVRGAAVDPALASEFFTPDEIDRAESYSFRARAWSWTSLAVSLICLTVLATRPVRRRLLHVVRARLWWLHAILVTLVVLLVQRLVTLPFAVGSFHLRREYGLTTQAVGDWLLDVLRGFWVGAVPALLVVLAVIGCSRWFARWWTAAAGLLLAGGVVLGSFVYPVLVEPLGHDFVPLAQGELRTAVEELAGLEGVAIEDIVVADASRRTTTLNAWVSGIGPTRRVVLYDTLVEQVPQEQVLVVVAHELAHARNNDVVIGTMLGAAGAVVGIGLLGAVLGRRQDADVVAAVPVLVLLLALGTQLAAPVQNGVSRVIERRADAVALEMTQDPDAFVEVQMSLARRSLADPSPPRLSQRWWGSHPTTLERVVSFSTRSPSRNS